MGRILGIDYGESRIGLAISDTNKSIAFPFKTIKNKNINFLLDSLKKLYSEKNIDSVVIGLPLGMNGKDTRQTKNVRIFSKSISILGLPIFFQDERLTSTSAKKSLIKQNIKTGHNKEKIDEIAATIFLQQFLDINKKI
tara:strand:- start:792 stop:1208 length:417 start_codon:yes stop_codon:yes gene_type:complete